MALLNYSVAALLLAGALSSGRASLTLTGDVDLRYKAFILASHWGGLEALGLSARKTFADSRGDRWTLYGIAEVKSNLSDVMLHEAWVKYKGPLGVWNLTAGRIRLPFGLLSGFSDDRLLYHSLEESSLGFDADNGLMFSGIAPGFDYSLSFTQGLGHLPIDKLGKGFATGRIGFQVGEFTDGSLGFSAAAGSTAGHVETSTSMGDHSQVEGMTMYTARYLFAADYTSYFGQATGRAEVVGGMVDEDVYLGAFGSIDYALSSKTVITGAVTVSSHRSSFDDEWFCGISYSPAWVTLRAGYTYSHFKEKNHAISLQAYRLFSATF